MIRPATLSRIEGAHRYSAFYRGYLANHLPMALVALDALGADDAAVEKFASTYQQVLEPMPGAMFAIEAGNEGLHLGMREALPAWVDFFEARLSGQGRDAVLGHWVDRLMPGVGAGAFHGAIRVAYALESGSQRELAHGLAYWAAVHESLAGPFTLAGSRSPAQVLASLAGAIDSGRRPPGKSIAERMRYAVSQPDFASLASSVDARQLNLDSLAATLLRCYGASGDFTILHGITGCHAFRALAPWSARQDLALAHLWVAVLAAYLSAGSPPVSGWALSGNDQLEWPAIQQRAALCDDEHDVKLAYSCWREWQRTGDDTYRRAASARVCHALREALAC